jgi:uncharacterized protein
MKSDVAQRAIDFFLPRTKNSERVSIAFYGGEPLLNFNILKESVYYTRAQANKNNIKSDIGFALTTNGTLLKHEIIRKFLIDNNFSLLVSLDGPKAIHDKYRRYISGKGTYDTIIQNLENIRKANPTYYQNKIGFSAVTLPENSESVVRFFGTDTLTKEATNFVISHTNFVDSSLFKSSDYVKQQSEFKKHLNKLGNIYKDYLVEGNNKGPMSRVLGGLFNKYLLPIYHRQRSFINDTIWPNGICLPGARKLFVSTSGNFHVCEKLGEPIKIGDIRGGFNMNLIDKLIDDYINISEKECINCWAVRLCGACYVSAQVGSQLSTEKKINSYCLGFRQLMSDALKMYCDISERNAQALSFLGEIEIS